VTAVTVLFTDE